MLPENWHLFKIDMKGVSSANYLICSKPCAQYLAFSFLISPSGYHFKQRAHTPEVMFMSGFRSTNSNTLCFNDSLNSLHEYIAFNSLSYLTPSLKGSISNQDIHNTSNDMGGLMLFNTRTVRASQE